ncbi:MAG: phosphatase PAP2 family protein [Lachnospiraceae bacterium]|nr:phosphatase PAP2 family protein [Lachnospiraceae bacterium]
MRYYFNAFVAVVLMAGLFSPSIAFAENNETVIDADSVSIESCSNEKFDARQLILPGALVAVGTFGVSNGLMKRINRSVNKEMLHISGGHHFRADNYIQYLPAATYLALGEFKGINTCHNLRDRAIITATSFAVMCAIVQPVKHIVGERRPDEREFDSFPSGHTATVFMGAELVRSEYSLGVGIAAYGVACGVGFFRLYNNRHWLNDVIAGAGIGILSARIGIWMLPVWKRLFHFGDDSRLQLALAPTYDVANRGLLLGGVMTF